MRLCIALPAHLELDYENTPMCYTLSLCFIHITVVRHRPTPWLRPLLLTDCGVGELGLCFGRLQLYVTKGPMPYC